MNRKLLWLNEKQIGDKLWDSDFFNQEETKKKYREFKIGSGIVDFACFGSKIDLFELKITVTTHSIFQILKYESDLESQLLNTFYFNNKNINYNKCPKVSSNLIGRFIDNFRKNHTGEF